MDSVTEGLRAAAWDDDEDAVKTVCCCCCGDLTKTSNSPHDEVAGDQFAGFFLRLTRPRPDLCMSNSRLINVQLRSIEDEGMTTWRYIFCSPLNEPFVAPEDSSWFHMRLSTQTTYPRHHIEVGVNRPGCCRNLAMGQEREDSPC